MKTMLKAPGGEVGNKMSLQCSAWGGFRWCRGGGLEVAPVDGARV